MDAGEDRGYAQPELGPPSGLEDGKMVHGGELIFSVIGGLLERVYSEL
jgi:hypothetical protein